MASQNTGAVARTVAGNDAVPFTDEQFLELGLKLLSNGTHEAWKRLKNETKVEHFRGAYGTFSLSSVLRNSSNCLSASNLELCPPKKSFLCQN